MSKEKILKYGGIILVIILMLFIWNTIRKTYIISKYKEQSQEYSKITNFYKKYNEDENSTVEIWRKDNIFVYKRTSEDGIRMIYNNLDEKIGWVINDTKTGDTVNKTAVKVKERELDNLIFINNVVSNEIQANNLGQYIKIAFMCSISSKDYYGVKCFEINFRNEVLQYINKENYLCIREINGSTDTGLMEYKLNDVTDEDVKLPDLSNFEIKEIH